MNVITSILVAGLLSVACAQTKKQENTGATAPTTNARPIYDFSVETIDGKTLSFAELKGKKVMIVNTASKCGLTPQYKELEALYQKYKDRNFIIIGFPANDFMSQEPGSNEEIASFCEKNYGVSFPMMAKISVKGPEMAPIYRYLTEKAQNGHSDSKVTWNFQKYLINANGYLVQVIEPRTSPMDATILQWIES